MINLNNYLILDIENNSLPEYKKYGRDAGNFKFDKIVAIGFAKDCRAWSWFDLNLSFLKHADVLVGHNFSHDLLFLWERPELQTFLVRGGRIWCTSYAHYCLTGQEETYPALRDIAVRCYGLPEREKLMEKYWDEDTLKILDERGYIKETYPLLGNKMQFPSEWEEQGKLVRGSMQTSQIPEALVRKDVEQDVLDTEQIYLQQIKIAKDLGMLPLLLAEMDSILATTEMTFNGVKVDRNTLRRNKVELEKDVIKIESELNQIVEKHWR